MDTDWCIVCDNKIRLETRRSSEEDESNLVEWTTAYCSRACQNAALRDATNYFDHRLSIHKTNLIHQPVLEALTYTLPIRYPIQLNKNDYYHCCHQNHRRRIEEHPTTANATTTTTTRVVSQFSLGAYEVSSPSSSSIGEDDLTPINISSDQRMEISNSPSPSSSSSSSHSSIRSPQ